MTKSFKKNQNEDEWGDYDYETRHKDLQLEERRNNKRKKYGNRFKEDNDE